MTAKDFLKRRRSCREFKDKTLSIEKLQEIENSIKEVSKKGDYILSYEIILNGNELYKNLDGYAGYNGVMINSPHYIAIKRNFADDAMIIQAAMNMEECITALSDLEIGSCYVTVGYIPEDIRKKAFGARYDDVNYILAIGTPKTFMMQELKTESSRLPLEEIVFIDEPGKEASMDELENYGLQEVLYYTRLAPSAMNKQPWRFLIKGHEVLLLTEKENTDRNTFVSLGIAMYYFQKLYEQQGHNAVWTIESGTEYIDNYSVIAKIKI